MSLTGSRASSPDVDFSVIRTAIEMGGKVIEQILNGIHYGSEEVRNLLLEESDFIMECKVCRNLFRSLPNLVAHKRVYCKEGYNEHLEKQNEMPESISEDTVFVHPELPETTAGINEAVEPTSGTQISVVDEVVRRTFVGKSQNYQFYTKVAEAAEKKKAGKVTNTVTLEPIASNRNAVTMTVSKEHKIQNKESPTGILKQILLKDRSTAETDSKSKTKPSLLKVVEGLASRKVCNKKLDDNLQCQYSQNVKARSIRSRKSSPRKSVDSYIGMKEQPEPETRGDNPPEDDSDDDLEEWFKDPSAARGNISCINDYVHEREWLEHCDIKKSYCKTCDKKFTSVYALKFHVKVKHTGKEGQYMCPKCGKTFVYFMALARHLRGAHGKSEPYIGKLQLMLRGALGRRKSLDRGVEDNSKQSVSIQSNHADDDLVQDPKIATNLLPYATGWKKCDKCGKVCWKAKSYNRHYQTCRGSEKEKESGVEGMNASKTHKRTENISIVKEVETTKTESLASKDMPYGTRLSKASQNKSIGTKDKCSSLIAEKITESACSVEDKAQKEVSSQNTNVVTATHVMDTQTKANSSPLNMKPQQKSVTEAVEKTIISTRSHGSVEIPNVVDVVQGLKSLEHNIEACSEKGIKELKKLKIDMVEYDAKSRESTEKIHMTKVSPRKVTGVKGSLTKCSPSSAIRTVSTKEHVPIKANEAETEAPKIPDSKLNSPKKVHHRSTDNISLESQVDQTNLSRDSSPVRMSTNSLSVPIGSPTDTPVISPTLYSIGSPSRHSESSYDGSTYGGKIPLRRMSVKEMAEIVESASLVKFARERGNKARRVLNKQPKRSTNSIPKRRFVRKQIVRKTEPTVERKVYGTRHLSKKEKDAHVKGNDTSTYETRSANHSVSDNQISNEKVLTSISSSDSITISLVEHSTPKQSNDIGVVDSSLKTGRIQLRQRKSLQNRRDDSDSNMKEKQEQPIISPPINTENLIPHGTSLLENSNNTPATQLADVALVSSIETRQLRARKSLNDTVLDSKSKHVERKRHQSESDTCKSGNSNTIGSDNAPNKGVKRPSKSSERANHGSSAEKMVSTPESNLYMEIDSIRKLRSIEKSSIVDKIETGSSKQAQVSKTISLSPHRKTKCNKLPVKQLLGESILDKSEKSSDETENIKQPSRDSSAKNHVPGSSACKGSDISIIDSSDQTNSTGTRSRTRNTSRLSAPSIPDNHPVEVLHEDDDKDKTDESTLSENDAPRLASLMKDISDIQGARHGNETSKRSETKLNSDRKTMLAAERMLRGQKDKNKSNIFELLMPGSEKIKEENYNKQEPHNANDSFNLERAKNTGNDKSYSDGVGTNAKIQSHIDSVPLSPVNSQHSDTSTADSHSHRTRLSTGTIAPLDLSYLDEDPTEPDRSDFALKYFTSTKELLPNTSAKGQLPAKSIDSSKGMATKMGQPSMNEPKRFSLQTGVIQCEKCHKAFWKKQSYQIHMRSSQCRDPDMVVVKGKHSRHMKPTKRALSISPNKSVSIDNVITSSGPSHSDKFPNVKRYKQDVLDRNKVEMDNSSSEMVYHSGLAESVTSVINIGTDTNSGNLKTSHSCVEEISLPQQRLMGSYGMQTAIAGPSHINLCEDSDDGSEFSGFSEADICNSSLELIDLNFDGDNDDSDDSSVDNTDENDTCASLADVSSLSADESNKESTKGLDKVFPNMEISATVGEKVKSNRKYVMDCQKSSKLRCQDQVRVDHLIDVKNKKCLECGLKFSSNSNVRRHAIRHLGWKRYRCNICQFSCYNLSECRIHLTKTHSVPHVKCDKESFSSFITDLNKEASKRRTVKRMKTIKKKKANESGCAITNLKTSSGTGYSSSKQLEHKSKHSYKEILGIQTIISLSENKMDEMSSVAIVAQLDNLHNRKSMKSPDESITEYSVKPGKSVDSPVKKSLRLAAKEDVRPSALEMLKGNSTLKVPPAINVNKANKVEIKTTNVAEKGNAYTRFHVHDSPAQTKDPPTKVNLGDSPLEIARLKLAKALDY